MRSADQPLGDDATVEARPLRARHLLGERERGERGQEQHQALGAEAAEDRGGHELGAERVADQVKPRRPVAERAERRRQQLAAQALAHLPRAPLHEPEGERVERREAHAAALRALAGQAHERVQLELLLGAERHLHLAERRDQPREQARLRGAPARRDCPSGSRDRCRVRRAALRLAVRERLRGPVDGHAERDHALARAGGARRPDARRSAARPRAPRPGR